MRHYGLVLLLSLFFVPLFSQDGEWEAMQKAGIELNGVYHCPSDFAQYNLFQKQPWKKALQQRIDAETYRAVQNNAEQSGILYTLPVVVHIIHNGVDIISDAQVMTAMQHLNEAFAHQGYYANEGVGTDMEIQFCLAKRAPDGSSTTGITRQQNVLSDMVIEDDDIDMKDLARWDPTQYINIYVVNEISSISSGAGVAGYAYFPSSHGQPEDGLVCEAQYFGKDPKEDAVMIHEMGHYVNLYHTFQGGCDNNDCLADGDRVCDTPPDEARQTVCVFNSCSTDTDAPSPNPFTSDVDDMTENYMDYSPFECYHRFTEGQKTRAVAAITGPRASLLDSKGCVDPCPNPIAVAFTPSATTVEMGVTVFFQNQTTGPNSYEWAVDGVPFSTAYNGATSFNAPGFYTVTLTANNGDPLCEQTISHIIEVTCNVKADLTVDNNPIDVNQTATFTEQSTNATTFEWYVLNSLEGIGQVFPYTFNFVGVFPVMLVASNTGCADTAVILQRVECDANPAFTTSDQFPLPGQTVTYTNVTTGVGAIEWYLDGIFQGTTNSIDFTFTLPGIYTVTLSVDNGNCTETISMEVRVFTPGNETCDNGIDDDGDGYVDCYDSDCQCFDGVDCKIDTVPAEFATRLAWRNETNRVSVNSTPVVANMNPNVDQIPEIIVVEGNGNGAGNEIYFYRGDGSNKGNPTILNFPPSFDRYPGASPSIADIDKDGLPELIVTGADERIYVYTNYDETANPPMQLMMQSGSDLDEPDSRPYLADFDQDGVTEIFVGTDIFTFDLSNPSSPSIVQAINGPTDFTGNTSYSSYSQGMKNPAAVDILNVADCNGDPDCEGLELVAGPIIYSIDLSTADGDPIEIKVQRDLRQLMGGATYNDGYTAVVDADLDGILDVVVTAKSASSSIRTGIYIWNKNGILAEHFSSESSGGSITCIANFFDDRTEGFAEDYPEILFCKRSVLYCFNLNKALQNQSYPYWWQLSTGDVSGFTGASVYDFNGDGLFEIVYRDEDHLRVLYGGAAPFPPGVDNERNYFKTPCGSITADEFPIVVDCDGDNETEIVVTGFSTSGTQGSNYRGRVSIYESDAKPWVPCRNVWNQVNYFVVNVNDDLKIPQQQQAHHLEFPGPGTGNRPFNRYLSQRQILDDQFQAFIPVPDLVGLFDDVQCVNDSLRVSYEVCNYGSNDLEPGSPITFYDNDPTEVNSNIIGDVNYLNDAVFIDSCVVFEAVIPIPQNNRIYGVVNDDGSLVRPYIWEDDFPSTDQPECQWPNNIFDFVFATTIPSFSLGPDIEVCPGNVTVLDAGAGHRGYRWQDGSTDRYFTASGPGKYWVDVDDSCLPLRSDTVEIIENIPFPYDLGPTTSLCIGDSVSLTIPSDYTTSTWTLDGDLLCQGCYDVTILPDSNTVIRVTAGITSCYVSDSIRLEILALPDLSFDTIVGLCDDVPGSASVLVSNPVGTMTYLWDDATVDAQNSRLEDGMAYVTVTDGNQCSIVDSVFIDAGNAFVVRDSVLPLLCSDSKAEISLTMQAGSGGVSYQWANGFGTDSILTNLDAGTYEVTATDDAGCIENLSFTLQAPPALLVDTSVTNVLCFGANTGKIIPSVNGGTAPYSLIWGSMGAADSLVDIAAGTYQLTVLDSNSCQKDITVEVTEPTELQALSSTILPTCPTDSSGSISFLGGTQGTAPYSYLWSNSATDTVLTDLAVGIYEVIITDANNCTKTTTFSVPEVESPEHDTLVQAISCYGLNDGAVTLDLITGNPADVSYSWSNSMTTQSISSLNPGSVDVLIGFGNGKCTMNYEFTIEEPDSLDIALVNKMDVLCHADSTGQIEIATSGGTSPYEVVWNSVLSTNQISDIPAGNYALLLTDDNGCTKTENYILTEPSPITLASTSILDTCNQNTGAIELTINGGVGAYNLTWVGSSGTVATDLKEGVYAVEILDDNGCRLFDSVSVGAFGYVPPLELPADTLTCTRTSIDILAKSNQNGLSYAWQGPLTSIPNDSTFATDMPGQYDLLVTTLEGCTNTAFVLIEQDTAAPNLIIFSDSLYVPCDDDFIMLSPNAVSTGADFTNTWTIWEGSQMVNQITGTDLNATRTALYVHDVVNIKNGCVSSDTVFVRNPEPLEITFEKEDISCKGADDGLFDVNVVSGGTPTYMYSVDNQPFVPNGLFQNMTPGLHTIEVNDGEDCTWSSQFMIVEPDSFSVDLTLDSSAVYLGGFAILKARYLPEDALVANIAWSSTPNSTLNQDTLLQAVFPVEPTEYIVQLMDDKGCVAEDRVMIDVYDIKIFAPNIIKPNSNEDFGFTLFGSEDVEEIIQLRVYDRWGAMVYQNSNFDLNNPTLGWDGTVLGKPANPAVFVWTAEVRMRDGKTLSLKGDVMVAR